MNLDNYGYIPFVGRIVSAVFDMGTVLLIYLAAKELTSKSQGRNPKPYEDLNDEKNNHLENLNHHLLRISNLELRIFPFLAAFFYAIAVLPIQLSHYYAVDTFLTFFLTASLAILLLCIKNAAGNRTKPLYLGLLGISMGLAIASKISAAVFLPIVAIGISIAFLSSQEKTKKKIKTYFFGLFLFLFTLYSTLRVAQPYLFAHTDFINPTLNPRVVDNWKQLQAYDNPNSMFPPGVQWITTQPYAFPLKHIILYGLGIPLGFVAILAVIVLIVFFLKNMIMIIKSRLNNRLYPVPRDQIPVISLLFLSLSWVVVLFIYQGGQYVKTMRYFIPLYPALLLITGWFVANVHGKLSKRRPFAATRLLFLFLIICCLWPIAFVSIYSRPLSRVTASLWIYKTFPPGSVIGIEQWDDALPVRLNTQGPEMYHWIDLPLYNADDEKKWEMMRIKLEEADYIILSSNRLYGSIMTVPNKYPITNRYYSALFDGSLGFVKIAEFTSRPNLFFPGVKLCIEFPGGKYGVVAKKQSECPLEGISIVDDYADENYTVFDHPKVIIFKKDHPVKFDAILP